jgi:hypothetical protein
MKTSNRLILSTSPKTQPARNPRKTASLALHQRHLYEKPRQYNTGKELDSETGLYYYRHNRIDTYLGTPSGSYKKYDVRTGELLSYYQPYGKFIDLMATFVSHGDQTRTNLFGTRSFVVQR